MEIAKKICAAAFLAVFFLSACQDPPQPNPYRERWDERWDEERGIAQACVDYCHQQGKVAESLSYRGSSGVFTPICFCGPIEPCAK